MAAPIQRKAYPLPEDLAMALFERFYEPCIRLDRTEEPDGYGGRNVFWRDAGEFEAAIVRDRTGVVVIAEASEMNRTFTVTAPVGTGLRFHEAFRRKADGQTFRVTSTPEDKTTPEAATFQFEQVTAEAWELPDE